MGSSMTELAAHVMLVVGGKDETMPSIQGINLHKALLQRAPGHVWLEKPGEMHGFHGRANTAELYTKTLKFIGPNIGPGASNPARR